MIICSSNNVDFIQGVVSYGNEPSITDWRIANSNGILNFFNSKSSLGNLSILENGNIMIGNASQAGYLNVYGDIDITGVYKNNSRNVINDTSNYVFATSNISISNIRSEVRWGSNYSDLIGQWSSNYISRLSFSGGSSQWSGSSSIYYNGGNIGIGTTNPLNNLHIYSSNNINANAKIIIQEFNSSNLNGLPNNITSSPVVSSLTISGSSTEKYITFLYNSLSDVSGQTSYTINVPENYLCDILVVGGGGAGGTRIAGGGGAGALIYVTNQTLASGSYTIKVGRGGIGIINNTSTAKAGENGKDSEIFNSLGSIIYRAKGGGGGDVNANAASTSTSSVQGGSSGGLGPNFNNGANNYLSSGMSPVSTNVLTINGSTTTIAPNNTSVYGYAGGGGSIFGSRYLSGGGGGAGGIGQSINASGFTKAGNGGSAFACTITGSSVAYAGGGGAGGGRIAETLINEPGSGGSVNGTQVGGNGGYLKAATTFNGISYPAEGVGGDAVANTGSGGGGSGIDDFSQGSASAYKGGSGGSGIVIIRYKELNKISLSSPEIQLIVGNTLTSGSSNYKIGNYNGSFQIYSSIFQQNMSYLNISSTGEIYNKKNVSTFDTTSDRRVKENIILASYDKCYENIKNLELYRFNYIKDFKSMNNDINQLGFIAQEVKDVVPKAVSNVYYNTPELNIPDLLTLDVSQIHYTLYGAVKKLIDINNVQEIRLKKLEYLLNIAIDTSNITIDTSNIAIDTSNITIDTSNITIDTSNIAIDTSNIAIDTSNIALDTSNISIDTSNISLDTSNIAIDTSNTLSTTSNTLSTTSNIALDTSNIALDTSNIALDTSNLNSNTSNIPTE